jgi:hypothetical protein
MKPKVMVIWGWPLESCLSIDSADNNELPDKYAKIVAQRIRAYCKHRFSHFRGGLSKHIDGNWMICLDDLSRPEKDRVWNFIKRQGWENGEA